MKWRWPFMAFVVGACTTMLLGLAITRIGSVVTVYDRPAVVKSPSLVVFPQDTPGASAPSTP
jgi:hypothetical protein